MKLVSLALPVTLLGLSLSAAAREQSRAETHRPSDARTALLAADRAHGVGTAADLRQGFVASLAEDAVLLWPTRPIVRGREPAAAELASLPRVEGSTMRWAPVFADVSADGTVGYSWGYGERGTPTDSGLAVTPFAYLAAWQRDAAGTWRVAAWMLAPGAPGQPAAAWREAAAAPSPEPCATASPPVTRPLTARNEVEERFRLLGTDADFSTYAATVGTGPAFHDYIAPNGLLIGGGPVVTCGRASLRPETGGPPGSLTWTPRLAQVAASGDLGFTIGVATVRRGEQLSHSKYLTIWKRQPDGSWRYVADGGNDAPAPVRP